MFTQEQIHRFKFMFDNSSAHIKAMLEEQQRKIEQETGIKPSLQELFEQARNGIEEELGLVPAKKSLLFANGLPGIRLEDVFGTFIPDLPILSRIKDWSEPFFPETFSEKERADMTKLYLAPRFHRLSHEFLGRLFIIAANEGMTLDDLLEKSGLPGDLLFTSDFYFNSEQNERRQEEVLTKLDELFGEKYGLGWIAANEPPSGKSLLHPRWICGHGSIEVWWNQARKRIAAEQNIPAIRNLVWHELEKKLNWMFKMPKFQKLSSSLHGRMDIICRIELISREQMAEELCMELEELDHPEEHASQIIEQLIERFGDEYGSIWLAYGLYGLDTSFAWQALKDDHAFLRRVPALFRKTGRTYISYASANGESLNGLAGNDRNCENCGSPVKGRSDKRFCSHACQRTYYNHQRTDAEELSGVNNEQTEHDKVAEPAKEKSVFAEFMEGPVGQILSSGVKQLVDRGAKKLGDQLFGVPGEEKEQIKTPEKPPVILTRVSGDELLKKKNAQSIPLFSDEFTQFFGPLQLPFRMLVWGNCEQGKSSFCLKFAQTFGLIDRGLYISAEENPEGETMLRKIQLNCPGQFNVEMVDALPSTKEQWRELMLKKNDKGEFDPGKLFIVYDSISKLNESPGLADRVHRLIDLPGMDKIVSHIYIAHAEKDGSTYVGPSAWEHEADIVVKIENGTAIMMKNRFKTPGVGQVGGRFEFFWWPIGNPGLV